MDSPSLDKFQERRYQVSSVSLRIGQRDFETSEVSPRFTNLSLFLAVKRNWVSWYDHS